MPARVENGIIIIDGDPTQAKASFFEIARSRVVELSPTLVIISKYLISPYLAKSPAYYQFSKKEVKNGQTRVTDFSIFTNPRATIWGQEDFSDLMTLFVNHEINEAWIALRPGFYVGEFTPAAEHAAHTVALRQQYAEAFKTGQADRCLAFMEKLATSLGDKGTHLLPENQVAYQLAKRRHLRGIG